MEEVTTCICDILLKYQTLQNILKVYPDCNHDELNSLRFNLRIEGEMLDKMLFNMVDIKRKGVRFVDPKEIKTWKK